MDDRQGEGQHFSITVKLMPKTPHNTERAYKVRISVQYDAMVFVRPGDTLADLLARRSQGRITALDIPENTQCKYVEDSMIAYRILDCPSDYDHLTLEQKDAIRTAAIENYAEGDGCNMLPGIDAGRDMFVKATITDCLSSFEGAEQTLLDFDPKTGEPWD